MEAVEIKIPQEIIGIYAFTDAERFPAAQLGEGLERASSLFWADFKVAIPFGLSAVKDTFERTYYKTADYKMVTELAVVMNHLCWEYYDKARMAVRKELAEKFRKFSQYFVDRYNEICEWVDDHFTPEQAQFFWAILD